MTVIAVMVVAITAVVIVGSDNLYHSNNSNDCNSNCSSSDGNRRQSHNQLQYVELIKIVTYGNKHSQVIITP